MAWTSRLYGEQKEIKLDLPPGLKNLGNTCFLNVVLQSLASVRSIHKYLSQGSVRGMALTNKLKETITNLSISEQAPFEPQVAQNTKLKRKFITNEQQDAHELMQFVLSIMDDEAEEKIPISMGIKDLFGQSKNTDPRYIGIGLPSLMPKKQNLRNPFAGLMRSTICVDCVACGRVSSISLQKFSTVSLTIPQSGQPSIEDTLEQFTNEETVSDVECPNCYVKRTRENPDRTVPTLEETPKYYKAKKRLSFARAPEVLCLHLRRLVCSSMGLTKSKRHVHFPTELDLSPYCSFTNEARKPKDSEDKANELIKMLIEKGRFSRLGGGSNYSQGETDLFLEKKKERQHKHIELKNSFNGLSSSSPSSSSSSSQLYHLVSVVVHQGDHLGGHYTVYRKLLSKRLATNEAEYEEWWKKEGEGQEEGGMGGMGGGSGGEGGWVSISDDKVKQCSEVDVLGAQAYMLYYEKY